jgi:hypothetical protein
MGGKTLQLADRLLVILNHLLGGLLQIVILNLGRRELQCGDLFFVLQNETVGCVALELTACHLTLTTALGCSACDSSRPCRLARPT